MVDHLQNQPAQRPEETESPVWIAVLLGGLLLMVGIGIWLNAGHNEAKFTQWRILLGVLATLAIFSILYRENPLFRFMEHIFIGLATGVGLVIIWAQLIYPKWYVPMMPKSLVSGGQGHWWLFPALLLGLLFYSVYFPRLSWMNRFAIGVLMGWAAGYAFREFLSMVGPQIQKSFKPPVSLYPQGDASINNIPIGDLWLHPWAIIFIVVLICTLAYFFFSVEHRARWIRQPAVAGRYFLMITLGAIFGTTVMGRFSLVIERLDFLQRSFIGWWQMLMK